MVGVTVAGSRWCAPVLPVVVAGDWLRLWLRFYGPAITGQGSVGLPSLRASGGPAERPLWPHPGGVAGVVSGAGLAVVVACCCGSTDLSPVTTPSDD
jgi:hypothetical protein